MSDEAATTPSKRGGRKAPAVVEKPEKVESKKRPRKEVKPVDSGDEDGVEAPKRGRGRPKGTTKKKAAPKAKSTTGRRGRPKKDEKAKSSEEEENEDEEDDAEEEDE